MSTCQHTNQSLGAPAADGGAFAFLTTGQFVPSQPYNNESLLVSNVNLNGMDCSRQIPAAGKDLPCLHSAGSGSGTASDGGCRAVYCCGYALSSGGPDDGQSPASEGGTALESPVAASPISGTEAPPVIAFGE